MEVEGFIYNREEHQPITKKKYTTNRPLTINIREKTGDQERIQKQTTLKFYEWRKKREIVKIYSINNYGNPTDFKKDQIIILGEL